MEDDFDIPSNTEVLDNALHEIHSEFIKAKEYESKANKKYLEEVMCVHMKFFWFQCDLLPFTNFLFIYLFIYLLIVFQNPYTMSSGFRNSQRISNLAVCNREPFTKIGSLE